MSRRSTRHLPERDGFAARFHEALVARQITSENFAREIDKTLRTVQRWRSGDSEPSGADLVLIASALGRDPSWFYEPDDDLTPAA
jgi:transcriptional regulator with XRE-family HTH domain